MSPEIIEFLRGATMVSFLAIGLFFLRFWKDSGDRLFAFFSAAFFLMAVTQLMLLLLGPFNPVAYWLRLLAFILIGAGIVQKNMPKNNSGEDRGGP